MIFINACTDTRALRCSYRTVRIIKFDSSSGHSCQCITEDGAKEHICMSGMNLFDRNSHLFHDVDTVFKRKYNSFLCSTNNMMFAMCIEVYPPNAATYLLIIQHTFRTITKRQDADTCAPDRRLGSQHIHFIVRDTFGSYISFYP